MNNPIRMSEILFRNFQLLVRCGLLHQLPVTEISDAFCHSVGEKVNGTFLLLSKVTFTFSHF